MGVVTGFISITIYILYYYIGIIYTQIWLLHNPACTCVQCANRNGLIMYTYKMLCYVCIFYIGSCLYIHIYIYNFI